MRDADRVQVAESLYMRGFISYPRTETDSFDVNFDHRTLMERQVPHTQWGNYAQRYDAERWTPTVGWPNAMGPCLPLCLTPSPCPTGCWKGAFGRHGKANTTTTPTRPFTRSSSRSRTSSTATTRPYAIDH